MNLTDAVLAGRYARALFEAAQAAKAADAVRQDLAALAQAWRKDAALSTALSHPRLSPAEKKAAVKRALQKAPHALTDRFVGLLLAKKRGSLLPATSALFEARADEAAGISRVQARTARPLADAQVKALSAALEKALKTKVALEVVEDEALLGGVVVRAGDRLWDLSLRGRLEKLREKLLETSIN